MNKGYMTELPKETYSLCPVCRRKISAIVYEEDNKIWIKKTCPEHGEFKELYFGDAEMYNRFRKFGWNKSINLNANIQEDNCPFSCGLCPFHKSHTALANIAVTNRCDLRCWYCFFYAGAHGFVFEPTLEEIREMIVFGRNEKPIPPTAIQITGGNPELRDDLMEIIKICKEVGYQHVQLNTQGTYKLWRDEKFVMDLKNAGVNNIYLSFDGVSKETNPKNHWEIPFILENCRKAKLGITLVPTLIKTVNDHEIGAMINFALNNIDIVRSLNIQPISFVGRTPKNLRERERITIADVIKDIEEQTNGIITRNDFYPVPSIIPITRFVEAITKKQQYTLSSHFICGAGTYIFLDDKKVVPITRFVDVEGFFEYLNEKAEEIENGGIKAIVLAKMMFGIKKFVDKEKMPKGINITKILIDILLKHDYSSLGTFHEKSLFIGMMHFQDLYNYDIERVERCVIHYLMPNNTIIPFCTYNVIPEMYRDKIMKDFSIPIEEWEKKHGKLENLVYHRNAKEMEESEIYKKTYSNIKNFFA